MRINKTLTLEKVEIDGPWIKCRPKESYPAVKSLLLPIYAKHMINSHWGDITHQVTEHKIWMPTHNNFTKKLKRKNEAALENKNCENRLTGKWSKKMFLTFMETWASICPCKIVRNE